MALTEMQKDIIENNPTMQPTELSKIVHCHPKTIANYRKKMKEKTVENTPSDGKKTENSRTRAISTMDGKNITDGKFKLTPEQLFEMSSIICKKEFENYLDAKKKAEENPQDSKAVWAAEIHARTYNQNAITLGKWYGMDKETNIHNTLNYTTNTIVASKEDVNYVKQTFLKYPKLMVEKNVGNDGDTI